MRQVSAFRFTQSGLPLLVFLRVIFFPRFGSSRQVTFFFMNRFVVLVLEIFRFLLAALLMKLFRFLFVELRPSNQRVGIRPRLGLFMLCFHQPRGERCQFFFA